MKAERNGLMSEANKTKDELLSIAKINVVNFFSSQKIYEKAKVHEKSFRIISFFSTSFGINKKE